MIRIDKYLHDIGLGSRKDIHKLIKDKRIKISNNLITDINYKIDENEDVYLDDKKLVYKKYLYLMLHKPTGYETTTTNSVCSVMNLLKDYEYYHLFPIGRLDKDTTGLLLFTNDGDFSHNIIHPKKHISKTYYVELDSPLSEEEINILEKGLDTPDFKTLPCEIKLVDKGYELTIYEGQYHQIKRMVGYFKKKVLKLHRKSIGNLQLDIPLGEIRELTIEERLNLLK